MAEIKMVSCCTCGYEWQQGRDGSHHCSAHMAKTIERQAAEIEQLRAAQSMPPASAVHGEIALRWRMQEDGLYAVDMMVSNLSTEEQAHAAMSYVERLFGGAESENAWREAVVTRETLELAALAAGMRVAAGYVTAHDDLTAIALESGEEWRPHIDDGESRRLQIAARIHLEVFLSAARAMAPGGEFVTVEHDGTQADAARAAREAVVRGAAAVGERMKGGER